MSSGSLPKALTNVIYIYLYVQLGARKGGLGATKVAANFDDIEREAIMAEKLKVEVCMPSVPSRVLLPLDTFPSYNKKYIMIQTS